ncbi:MAG TPA: tryptophan synthase subunit alpha [Acidimicrobiia bacterium]|nr:tryptophan synthase subunit alpha [Acidimicrobiia bacterium]
MSDRIDEVTRAIEAAGGHAICAYVTAGYPSLEAFPGVLAAVAGAADIVEVGVPFTDPMADGQTIQKASHEALEGGVNLDYVFSTLGDADLAAPHLLMGYYNPFLAFGIDRLVDAMADAGTAGLIVPDLPFEESGDLSTALETRGQGLVQLVSPTTPDQRLARLAATSLGFVYAVTTKGTTGSTTRFDAEVLEYLDRVKAVSRLPVLAGFGVRERSQVVALSGHVDGVVVGSALIDALDRGEDPGEFLEGLRPLEVVS